MKIEYTSSLLAVLDDDRSVQRALQSLFESEGMSAHCFASAEQFLDSTVRHDASCLIADIRMPGMSGLELQTKLKAERCRIPIIFITARGDIPMTVRAMKDGANDFLTKPINAAALVNSIERRCNSIVQIGKRRWNTRVSPPDMGLSRGASERCSCCSFEVYSTSK